MVSNEYILPMPHNNLEAIILRVLLAFILAAIIGIERASKRHFAGLRTFTLTAMASVFAALCDVFIINTLNARVSFLSAAVVIGMATLNGNTILFSSRNQLTGLTTSVALWATGVLSLCLGFGMYTLSILGFLILMVALALFPRIEALFKQRSRHFEIHVELNARNNLPDFVTALRKVNLHVDDIESNPAYANSGLGVFSIKLTILDPELLLEKRPDLIAALSEIKYVHFLEEIK